MTTKPCDCQKKKTFSDPDSAVSRVLLYIDTIGES